MVEDKEKKDKQPTVAEMKLEDRVEEMHEKADAKTAKFEALAENETDADKKRKYEYKALRAQEKADNKEERMRDRFDFVKDFKESTKAEWDQYVDAFLGTHIAERKKAKAEAEAKAKASGQQSSTTTTTLQTPTPQTPTPPQTPATPPQGEVVTTNVAQTPQREVATTEVQATGTTPTEVQTNEPNFAGERASAFERYKALLKEGNSPYQTLIQNALAKKEEIADRRVRDARSTALSNALGTLTNVLTAGALARKNGTIPIVSAHDKEPDTNLRKSIEGRYQLENENENFLLKLADERRKYEADLANKAYQNELAEINTRQKYYEEQKRRDADNAEWDRREAVRHENNLERIETNNTAKSSQNPKKFTLTTGQKNAQNQFVNATTKWKEKEKNVLGEEIETDVDKKDIAPYMRRAYEYFVRNKYNAETISKTIPIYRAIVQQAGNKLNDNLTDAISKKIGEAIKEGKLTTEEIIQIAIKSINKSNTTE